MPEYTDLRYGHASLADLGDRLRIFPGLTRFEVWVTGTRVTPHGPDEYEEEHGWLDGYWGTISSSLYEEVYQSRNDASPILSVTMDDVDPNDPDCDTFPKAIAYEWGLLTKHLPLSPEYEGDGNYYVEGDHAPLTSSSSLTIALHPEIRGAFNGEAPLGSALEAVRIIDLPITTEESHHG